MFFSNLQLLSLIYLIFTCVDLDPDPCSEYGSGSTKFLNTDPIWIQIRIASTNPSPSKMPHNPWLTSSIAGVVVGLINPDLVGVDGGGGVPAPLLHLYRPVPLPDPDLRKDWLLTIVLYERKKKGSLRRR